MISEVDKRLLSLLSAVLHRRPPETVPTELWPDMLTELTAHTVLALPAAGLFSFGLSPEDEIFYLNAVISSRQNFHSLLREQTRILSLLEQAEIPAVVLKGMAAAAFYPNPEDRSMGDIDLLVAPPDLKRAFEVLIAGGCTSEQRPEDRFERHLSLRGQDSCGIELHDRFSGGDERKENNTLDRMLYDGIPRRVNITVGGQTVPILPPVENGLVLLSHINMHLTEGLGLRQIIDWMLYAEAYLDDGLWENSFAPMAEKIGLKRLAEIVTGMCRKYLGLEGNIHWDSREPICDELMEYVLRQGNFGRKARNAHDRTVKVMKFLRDPLSAFSAAQAYGLYNWNACKKHKWLRPFAWIYQICRWVRLGLKNKVTAEAIEDASAAAKEELDFLRRLGVTRL